jgi:hypothetical protein
MSTTRPARPSPIIRTKGRKGEMIEGAEEGPDASTSRTATRDWAAATWDNSRADAAHDITRRAMFAAGTTRTHEPRAHRNGAVAVKQQRFVAKRKGALY